MACQFTFFLIFCTLFNIFCLYYVVIFCDIYRKSIESLFQSVYLSALIDMVIVETFVPFLQSGFRSAIKMLNVRYV